MRTLEELIDEAIGSGQWHSIRIFNGVVSMGRDQTSFTVDQLTAESPPSAKLRWLLEHNLGSRPVVPLTIEPAPVVRDEIEDLLG